MASWSKTKPTWSLNQIINNLNRGGESWPKRSLTYRFTSGISSAQKTAITRALRSWSNVANLRFTNTTSSSADITFSHNSNVTPAAATWWYSGSNIVKAKVEFNAGYWENKKAESGGAFQGIMVHEIGHTLGFLHPGNYDGWAVESQRLYQQDSLQYTVMSYFDHPAPAIGFSRPAEPLLHDIAAVQKIYGKNTTFRSGNTVYKWGNTGKAFQAAIWDTGGTDTIDGSNHSTSSRGVRIDLRAGRFSSIGGNSNGRFTNNVAIAFGVTIENATGGVGKDTLTGNGANNVLRGGGGNDTLYGMGGNDTLYGGAGNDLLDGGPGNDRLVGGSGRDTYVFSGTWGRDTVIDNGGILRFTDRTLAQLTRTRSGSNLIITHGANTVTVRDYYSNRSQWEIRTKSSDDYAASTSTTGRVSVGGSATGNIEKSSDKDWFRVRLVRGHRYQFDLSGVTNSDVTLRLRDASGRSLLYNDNVSSSNRNSRIVHTANYTGYYFLEAGANGSRTGTYKLTAKEFADDFSASTGTKGRLSVGGYSRGNIEKAADKDWFRVSLVKGRRYQFDLSGDTNRDVQLRLRDASGRSLLFNDDIAYPTNLNSRITYTANRTGYYYLEAGAYGSNSGTYKLTAKQLSSSSALGASQGAMAGAAAQASMPQQNLVFNEWNARGLSNSVTTPLSASFEKDWQKNLLAFSRG